MSFIVLRKSYSWGSCLYSQNIGACQASLRGGQHQKNRGGILAVGKVVSCSGKHNLSRGVGRTFSMFFKWDFVNGILKMYFFLFLGSLLTNTWSGI